MNINNLLKIALRALTNNKLRAFLTMLGIIIGVASVITMLAIGQGSKRSIQAQISEMGSNMIMIHPGGEMRGGVRQDPSEMQTLKLENYQTLSEECTYLSAISPQVSSSGQLIHGANNYPSSVSGVSIDYLKIRQLTVEQGDMFTEADIKTSAKVCVIGKTIVDNLFPDGESPIGKIIRFNKIPFRVVGVLKSKGYNSMGMDQDDIVLAPYTTVMKRLLAVTYLEGIFASALTEDMTDYATDEISRILRREHKLKATDDDDFSIRSQQELSSMLSSTTGLMTTLLACMLKSQDALLAALSRMQALEIRFPTAALNQLAERLLAENPDPALLMGELTGETAALMSQAMERLEGLVEPEATALDCVNTLARMAIRARMEELSAAYTDSPETAQELSALQKKLTELGPMA